MIGAGARRPRIAVWRWDADAREVYAVRCPKLGGVGLVTAIHPYWFLAYVEDSRALAAEDAEQVSGIVAERWQVL